MIMNPPTRPPPGSSHRALDQIQPSPTAHGQAQNSIVPYRRAPAFAEELDEMRVTTRSRPDASTDTRLREMRVVSEKDKGLRCVHDGAVKRGSRWEGNDIIECALDAHVSSRKG